MPKLSFYRFVVEAIAVVIIGLYHETFNLKKTGHICFDFVLAFMGPCGRLDAVWMYQGAILS